MHAQVWMNNNLHFRSIHLWPFFFLTLAAFNSEAIREAEMDGSERRNRGNNRKCIIKGDIIQLLWCSIENIFHVTLPSLLCVTMRALLRNMSVNNGSALHLSSWRRRDYCGKEINGSLLETFVITKPKQFFNCLVFFLSSFADICHKAAGFKTKTIPA